MRKILLAFFILVSTLSYGQVVTIPDSNFKKALVSSMCVDSDFNGFADIDADLNDDGEIQIDEAEKVKRLFVIGREISNLDGINSFKNIELLKCEDNKLSLLTLTELPNLLELHCKNNQLTQLALTSLPSFALISCEKNQLTKLTLSNLLRLDHINCENNKLTELTLINLPSLRSIICAYNKLTELALPDSPLLYLIACANNQLSKLTISNLPNLQYIYCINNKMTELTLTNLPSLWYLSCEQNQLTQLYLSDLFRLRNIYCLENPLSSLFIKQGDNQNTFSDFSAPTTIKYICADENKINYFKIRFPKAEVNTYCSFTPGGKFYTIVGKAKFDENKNGCDTNDIDLPFLKYEITNGIITGSLYGNEAGLHSISVQAGSHTIKPSIENQNFFSISPTSKTITFPSTYDTITENFCITAKQTLSQTDITILPLTPPARPGFDAKFKVILSNKGTQRESGTLNFRYNEALLDYVKADTIPKTKGNGLVAWDFKDLHQFETRTFTVTLKVNKPTDTPAVNAGDTLIFTASILDNVFTLNNRVVGSYDPNDKTCLEGDKITPNLIDKYVHYLIRFENTGTYAAENVVVKDSIDNSIFDINSLQITDASHRSFTRINGNVVEFIFEDIKLPFDDATNDGYIAFKIKTKPTLKVGNVLKNKANIYFDYNFPIITNEAKTVIANTVNTHNIQADDEISIYPNPAADFFRIDSDAEVSKVDIYDLSGRLLQSNISVENQVDIKGLNEGTYIVKVYSERGVRVGKMVKGKM
jgi:uncharacterized repeat protein (TIGR01451 family)